MNLLLWTSTNSFVKSSGKEVKKLKKGLAKFLIPPDRRGWGRVKQNNRDK